MDQLISTFHIDIKLLIAQAINFGLVVFVLYKFAYKPLLSHMNERSAVIGKGLEDAKKAQEELEMAQKRGDQKMQEAKKEARKVLEEAQKQAERNKEAFVEQSKQETAKIVDRARQQIAFEKEKMLKEVKGEVSQLVVMVSEKVLASKIDEKKDKELIDESIARLS